MAWHHVFNPFCSFFFILLIVFIVFMVFRIISFRRCGGWNGWQSGRMDAEAILRRRLANGDISEEEYQKVKDILSK